MVILIVLIAKVLRRMETGLKIIKIGNQFLLFLPAAKHSGDLGAHKIKRITTVKRAMTRSNATARTKPKIRHKKLYSAA